MATLTVKLSSYTTIKLTYNIENVSNTATRLTVTGYTFTNTRTNGTTEKVWLDIFGTYPEGSYDTWYNSNYEPDNTTLAIAKGTKSFSKTITRWYQWNRKHSSRTGKVVLIVDMWNANDDDWYKETTVSVSVPAIPSYTVTYNANGGTGGPPSQTKWYGETLQLIDEPPEWDSAHGFNGWGTSKTATQVAYARNSSYSANASITLYAIWSVYISYASNGTNVSGMPDTPQHKYAYTDTNISTKTPVRPGYDFKGWATSSGGEVAYQPGALYTSSDGATLYAVWAVTPPTVSVKVERAVKDETADLPTYTPSLIGGYGLVTVTYSLSSATQLDAVSCSVDGESATLVSSSGTTAVYASASQYGLTEQPTVEVSVSDAASNVTTKTQQLPTAAPPIHFKPGGGGVGIGVPSVKDGFAVGMDAFFRCWAGVIQMFAGSTPPAGWLLCDGSAVSRTDYAVLFAAIGTTWGVGDGSTTFNLPDLRGRAPIGAGAGSGLTARTLGGKIGSEHIQAHTHAFTQPKIPNHVHSTGNSSLDYFQVVTSSGVGRRTVGNGGTNRGYVTTTDSTTSYDAMGWHQNTGNPTSLGSCTGGAVGAVSGATTGSAENMQPSAVVNFIIHTGKTS